MKSIDQIIATLPPVANGWNVPASLPPITAERQRLGEMDASHPGVARAIAAARQWGSRRIDVPEASLILLGPVGTGKTTILKACMWAVADCLDGEPVAPAGRFFTADELMYMLTERVPMGRVVGTAPIIGIDDIGTERRLEYVSTDAQADEYERRYEQVIDWCYRQRVGVVISTNLEPDELAARVGRRAWSRLMEMAPRGYVVDMGDAPDYRMKLGGRA